MREGKLFTHAYTHSFQRSNYNEIKRIKKSVSTVVIERKQHTFEKQKVDQEIITPVWSIYIYKVGYSRGGS